MSNNRYLYRKPPKKLEEFKDPELRKEIEFLRKKEDEAEKRIEERSKSKELKKERVNPEQREQYKKDTKNFLIAVPMILIGPFFLLFAFILFAAIPGSDIIALIFCLIGIASMIWAIFKGYPSS